MPKTKKVPQRKCLGCQAVRPKKELIRVVRTPEGEICLDISGKKAGRGAYICPDPVCLQKTVKSKQIQKALGVDVDPQFWDELASSLPK